VTFFDPDTLSGVDAAITLVLHVELLTRHGASLEELAVLADKSAVAPLVRGALGDGPHARVLAAALRVGVEQGHLVESDGIFCSTPSASDSLRRKASAAELLRALR
jgi:hypothetical protein